MTPRLAWVGEGENSDSYCAAEARVFLRAPVVQQRFIPLWFAVGSREPPHRWNGVRVFPAPGDPGELPGFLGTLLAQQRPDVIVSSLPSVLLAPSHDVLSRCGAAWLHRNPPDEPARSPHPGCTPLVGSQALSTTVVGSRCVPYVWGLELGSGCASATLVTDLLLQSIDRAATGLRSRTGLSPQKHIVLRQHAFCNVSLSHVMFELTNALLELRYPAVPQPEHALLQRQYICSEEALYASGASLKYQRALAATGREYDPETAVTVHFVLSEPGSCYTRHGVFPSLCGREALYTTGNHTVAPRVVADLAQNFDALLAPSRHVLRPYLDAGWSARSAAVIPHGVDPAVYSPIVEPLLYPTRRQFKFLQTSFPWVAEKGFDLTVKAFCRAFSASDDVSLILRVPVVRDAACRDRTFGRLQRVVAEETAKPAAPEVHLIETDVAPDERGRVYTGADCYVHPLRAEGFGMTILEAMACGLPVIATPWSGPADFLSARWARLIQHSRPVAERMRTGFVSRYHVEPDLDHLIFLMRTAFQEQEAGRRLGALAAEVARSQWTWQHAADKLGLFLGVAPFQAQQSADPGRGAKPRWSALANPR
jgi:glycosyltransferase involved in cell wall biosynthesis